MARIVGDKDSLTEKENPFNASTFTFSLAALNDSLMRAGAPCQTSRELSVQFLGAAPADARFTGAGLQKHQAVPGWVVMSS